MKTFGEHFDELYDLQPISVGERHIRALITQNNDQAKKIEYLEKQNKAQDQVNRSLQDTNTEAIKVITELEKKLEFVMKESNPRQVCRHINGKNVRQMTLEELYNEQQ